MIRPVLVAAVCMSTGFTLQAAIIPVTETDFSSPSMIDFESQVSTALPISSEFTFDSSAGNGGTTAFGLPVLFGNAAYANTVFGPGTQFTQMRLEFTTPVEGAGMYVSQIPNFLNDDAVAVQLSAFNTGGTLLGSTTVTLPSVSEAAVFLGLASTGDAVKSIILTSGHNGPGPAGFFGADNITFGDINAVPEPSTLFALSFMTAGGLWHLRRRQCGRESDFSDAA